MIGSLELVSASCYCRVKAHLSFYCQYYYSSRLFLLEENSLHHQTEQVEYKISKHRTTFL